MDDWQKNSGQGQSRTYSASIQTVWDALPAALKNVGLQTVEANRDQNYLLAERGSPRFDDGEKVMVFLQSMEGSQTQVKVSTRLHWSSNVLAEEWSSALLNRLDKTLSKGP